MTPLDPQNLNLLIVIVCYKAADLTIDCLRSLSSQIADVPATKVAICENGTGADSVRQLAKAIEAEGWSDWVMLKPVSRNRGFPGGNNPILRDAMNWPTPPKYFMLLNADTIVHTGALSALYGAIEADPSLGIIGPRLVSPRGEVQNSCFRDPSPLSEFLRAARTGVLNRLCGRSYSFALAPVDGATEHDWISFACALIRGEVLNQIGLLDEGYFLYCDDRDYCRRAREAGWRIGHCPEATVMHLEGRSNPVPSDIRARRRPPMYYYVSRSRYFGKFLGRFGLWATNLCWLAGRWVSITRELLGTKGPHLCEKEWLDIWVNWRHPVVPSESTASWSH